MVAACLRRGPETYCKKRNGGPDSGDTGGDNVLVFSPGMLGREK